MTDPGFKELILQLIGSAEKRPSATELLEHPLLHTEVLSRRNSLATDEATDPSNHYQIGEDSGFIPVTDYVKVRLSSLCNSQLSFSLNEEEVDQHYSLTVSLLAVKGNRLRFSFIRLYGNG